MCFPKAQMELEGSVKIGCLPVKNFKSHNFGFMYQHNLFCGALTVKEHLYFMVNMRVSLKKFIKTNKISFQAKLKLDRRTSKKNVNARVSAIIEELGLGRCANTRIGVGGENGKVHKTKMC